MTLTLCQCQVPDESVSRLTLLQACTHEKLCQLIGVLAPIKCRNLDRVCPNDHDLIDQVDLLAAHVHCTDVQSTCFQSMVTDFT